MMTATPDNGDGRDGYAFPTAGTFDPEKTTAEMVMVRAPDGSGKLELVKYHAPANNEGAHPLPANRLGFRHIPIGINDLNTIVDGLQDKDFDTVGEIRDFEDTYRLCYVRGPEGLIRRARRANRPEGAS